MDPTVEVHPLVARAWEFKQQLDARKAAIPEIEWYPYDSLSNVIHLERLLSGTSHDLAGFLASALTADLGCADGDLAFFLESLGSRVHAFDHPASNHNTMKGVRRLKAELGSEVAIHAVDLDSKFTLPEPPYKAVLLLGALYHLRNPFHVLQTLSAQAEYCLLSTRVARRLPTGGEVSDQPVAYLVEEDELNGDSSNFWIFSHAGLRRLCRRTGWHVERMFTCGDTAESNPIDADHDERAFCLLRSTRGVTPVEFAYGAHAAEDTGWRWMERHFGIRAGLPAATRSARLRMTLFYPPWLAESWGPIRIAARDPDGALLREFTLEAAGNHSADVALTPRNGQVEVHCETSHCLEPDESDRRQRGIILSSATINHTIDREESSEQ